MSHILIGLTGRKEAGKDTVANHLCAQYGFRRLSVATPLKCTLADIFGFSDEQLNGSLKEVVDPYWQVTPREVAQFVGTELFRVNLAARFPQIGENIWTRVLERQLMCAENANASLRVVVTDIRYPNEANLIKKMGGTIIRVVRERNYDCASDHVSETSMDDYPVDLIIRNNASINKLNSTIDLILRADRNLISSVHESHE